MYVQYVYDDYWMYNMFMTITGLISYYLSVTRSDVQYVYDDY
jgi:hypothetical protein